MVANIKEVRMVVEGNNYNRYQGCKIDSFTPYFKEGRSSFENAYVLFYSKKVSNIQEIFPAISQANRANRPLVIIAEDFENDVMSTLVVNRMRGTFNGCAVKAPGVLHQMKVDFITDAAYATGGTVICDDLGIKLEDVTEKQFGKAKRIDVTAFTTTFVEGSADDELFNQRVNELRVEITKDEVNEYRRGVLRERLAKLVAGIGVVKVVKLVLLLKKNAIELMMLFVLHEKQSTAESLQVLVQRYIKLD